MLERDNSPFGRPLSTDYYLSRKVIFLASNEIHFNVDYKVRSNKRLNIVCVCYYLYFYLCDLYRHIACHTLCPYQVDNTVGVESGPPLCSHLTHMYYSLRIITVHVEYGGVDNACHVRTIRGRAGESGIRRKPNLVIHNNVNRAWR